MSANEAEGSQFLDGVRAVVVEQGLGKARQRILSKQLVSRGGELAKAVTEQNVTHVVVGGSLSTGAGSRLPRLLKVEKVPDSVSVVSAEWLSSCLVEGKRVRDEPYLVKEIDDIPPEKKIKTDANVQKTTSDDIIREGEQSDSQQSTSSTSRLSTSPIKFASPNKTSPYKLTQASTSRDSDSDYCESGEEEEEGGAKGAACVPEGLIKPIQRKGRWVCEIPSSERKSQVNHNKHITDKLEELLTAYKTSGVEQDRWRAMSLTKVLAAIKRHPKEITSYEEARSIPFTGERLANKIAEIISSGTLRRLNEVDREKQSVIELFKGVHGIGQNTAEQFYAQGYRTLDDLRESGKMNRQQVIGLAYYDEFKERMHRSEVQQIEQTVREACESIDPALMVVTCGSYRRGRETCGDVDILVTHPDGRSHKGVFSRLTQILKQQGFLTDDLSIHDDPTGGQCKYLGVCKLPGDTSKHRRIDIYIAPYSEYHLTLLHFTGSGHFNRSMRSKADKMGMSLSEHSLNAGVIRKNGVKIFEGTPLPVFSEEDVFRYLDMKYLEPHDRDWPS